MGKGEHLVMGKREHYGEGGRAFGDGEGEHLVMGRESIW